MLKSIEQIIRDKYYEYLMKQYNEYDLDDLIGMIDDEENEIREYLEIKAMS